MHQNLRFSICDETHRKETPMHAMKLLHTLFDNACQTIDKRLRKAVFLATESLTRCKQLSISGLGRSLNRTAAVKHNIKCIDRFFETVKKNSSSRL